MSTSIAEGNKIIAEFMGGKWWPKSSGLLVKYSEAFEFESKVSFGLNQLKYHSSFDWLMPACRKFDTLEDEFPDIIMYELLCDEIDNAVTRYEITPVWESLVKAIQWYNSLTPKQQ